MALDTGHVSMQQYVDRERGLISRQIFVNPDLYDIELERVFARCWLFVGFVDQVRKPGDYFVSRMGEESVILTRDRQDQIHVFLNSCRHRGMKVCRYDEGNTPVFTCPYHGWSFGLGGDLVGVPHYKEAYYEELDKSEWGLIEVAQLHIYKGTVWATWDPDAPPFEEYVGDNLLGLGLFLDKEDGSEADMEVLGLYKWVFPANWKFGSENFLGDGYHGTPTHRSVELVGINPAGGRSRMTAGSRKVMEASVSFNISHHGSGRLGLRVAPPDLPFIEEYQDNPVVQEYYRSVYERRKRNMGERWRLSSGNGNIFPNTTQGTRQSICVWHPNGVDSTECWRWYYVDRDAPDEVKDMLRHYYMRYGGPTGLTEEDDMENWNYAHKASKGTIAKRYPYHYAMGLGHEIQSHPALDEFGIKVNGTASLSRPGRKPTEQNQRGAYYFWADLMEADTWDDLRTQGRWP